MPGNSVWQRTSRENRQTSSEPDSDSGHCELPTIPGHTTTTLHLSLFHYAIVYQPMLDYAYRILFLAYTSETLAVAVISTPNRKAR